MEIQPFLTWSRRSLNLRQPESSLGFLKRARQWPLSSIRRIHSTTFQYIPQLSNPFHNLPIHSTTFQSIPQPSNPFQNLPIQSFRINLNIILQDFHGKSCIQQEKDSFYQQIGLKFEEETNKMLHLRHGSVWRWNLDTSGSRSEKPGKFRNVVLEKDGEDQLDRSREKWRSVTWSQWAEEYPTRNKKTEG